ncbi:uncharacterized protein K452DRAFT_339344 [Aplosporella prunicola CBS 121167]|uniref:BTB domain-containing protein n=1 Tax=Aplosporella prunicola CBS 121167 TaxID=1176127 RepID=A0A6A6B4H8_9PEZI|nr:uncharacterized protein K452DRAFT_339344 [Aplosporella prunicola CBS 121167]KAF2138114.1 hypothetical protein K452DRAFT_339344 [Aplosporella prunicola CBS 121167]
MASDDDGPVAALTEGLKSTFLSGDFTDLVIRCKSMKWNVHKIVLCSQSEFFKRACLGGFRESKENSIDLSEDNGHIVHAMLEFLYSLDYTFNPSSHEEADFHAEVYLTAEKYGLTHLKGCALGKFKKVAETLVESPARFATVIVRIFDGTPNSDVDLRSYISQLAAENHDVLLSCPLFQEYTEEGGDFNLGLMRALASRYCKCDHNWHLPTCMCNNDVVYGQQGDSDHD